MEPDIINFLKKITKELETKKLSSEQLTRVSEFYISYNFEDEMSKKLGNDDLGKKTDKKMEKELISFLALGWYIYSTMDDNN